ncbi:MAG TPA: hypothetical protein VHN14_34440 [Kofleriaceae bacterium]|jgi:hypothetical protein|nr:hypothetical protein [Kofleriaceae bacterium]
MKFVIDALAGVTMYGVAYYLARPYFTETQAPPVVWHPSAPNDDHPLASSALSRTRAAIAGPWMRAGDGMPGEAMDAGPSAEQQSSMNTLRNEVIRTTAEDMHRRDEDVMACLDGTHLADVEKIRFSVEVVSTPDEATTGRWRLVEIVDGEPLPDSFASCAARAFGGGQHLVPPKGLHFPQYRGELSILYTIPAPPAE